MQNINTSNVFARYFLEKENGEIEHEKFVSISDLDQSGAPFILESGEPLDNDCLLYALQDGRFIQIEGVFAK